MELIQQRLNLETFEPHARCLQIDITVTAAIPPSEIIVAGTTDSVDAAVGTVIVPESSSSRHSAVPGAYPVVVTVIRTEHHPVAVTEGIVVGVATVPRHTHPVVVRLICHSERAVLGPVPTISTSLLQFKPQLVPALLRQLTQSFIAKPEVAVGVAEPNFKLSP